MQNQYEINLKNVLSFTDGALLASVKNTARVLGITPQTVYNQICIKTFQFEIIKRGNRSFVRATDLAEFIAFGKIEKKEPGLTSLYLDNPSIKSSPKRPIGRPRKGQSKTVQK